MSPGGVFMPILGFNMTPQFRDPQQPGEMNVFSQVIEQTTAVKKTNPALRDWGRILASRTPRTTADLTLAQTGTLQNIDDASGGEDTNLVVSLPASRSFWFRAFFRYDTGTTPDIKFDFIDPAGCASYAVAIGIAAGATAVTLRNWTTATGALAFEGAGAGTPAFAIFEGTGTNGTTAGTFQAQAAQNTADASDTKVLTASYLWVWYF